MRKPEDSKLPPENWKNHPKKLISLAAAFYFDLVCHLLFYGATTGWDGRYWELNVIMKNMAHFYESSSDLMVVCVVRILLVSFLTFAAVIFGAPHRAIEKEERKLMGRNVSIHNEYALNQEESLNLLVEDQKEADPFTTLSEKEKYQIKKKSEVHKNLIHGVLFMVITACQVLTGIKCVVFTFPSSTYLSCAIIGCSLVFWLNLELFLTNEIIRQLTRDTGHIFKAIHSHPLYYTDKIAGHMCDLCYRSGLRESFRCHACDYDLCLPCTKKKNKDRGEGLLRGDSGVKEIKDVSNWEYMKKVLHLALPDIHLFLLAFTFLLINSVSNLLLPNYQGVILDDVISKNSSGFKRDILIFIGLSVAVGLFGGIRNLCFNLAGRRMENAVRTKLFRSILIQDMAFFDGVNSGDLTSRLSDNTSAMIEPAQTLLSTVLSSAITLIGGVVMCIYTSWQLSVLAFTTIGPIIIVVKVYAKWSARIHNQIWAALGDANSLATEALNNIRTVRAFSCEFLEYKKYKVSCDESLEKGIKDAWAGAGTFAFTEYMELSISVLLLWYGGSVAMEDSQALTVGKLITFQLYWNMLRSSYGSLVENITSFTKAGGAAQRVIALLDNLPDINPDEGEQVEEVKGDIELRDVEYYYQMRPDIKVLKGINLNIKSGQVCALVGKSGSGKSTMIHLLMRFYDPKSGGILLDGKDYRQLNPISLRKHIGIVAQDTELFNLTIEENIAYGVEDNYTKEELYQAAKLANAHDFITEFDEGYETRVGEGGLRLSGGQKQRIALARVFLRKPKLLFLDEATSALDSESEAAVQEAIDTLISLGGCTVVLVAHRLSTVINADLIGVVHEGRIVELGTHNELLKKKGIYEKLVKRQVARMANTIQESEKDKQVDIIDTLIEQMNV